MSTRGDKVRINIRIPAELMQWARGYAQRNHITVTSMIVESLQSLRSADTVRVVRDDGEAPQI